MSAGEVKRGGGGGGAGEVKQKEVTGDEGAGGGGGSRGARCGHVPHAFVALRVFVCGCCDRKRGGGGGVNPCRHIVCDDCVADVKVCPKCGVAPNKACRFLLQTSSTQLCPTCCR